MQALGSRLASAIAASELAVPVLIGLTGELGAGKTTLVGGLLAALGHEGPARSPTYTLVEPYRFGGRDVYHCDLYRLRDPSELDDLGLRDLLTDGNLLLVEWPERAGERLPVPDLAFVLSYGDPGRVVEITAHGAAGARLLAALVSTKSDEDLVSS
jgi:tRNA threonylcarbamoyladenosine biosynthesis protein TsaE